MTSASPTGRVTFYDGVTVLGTEPLVAGAAYLSTGLLPAGNHKLNAYYAGDASHAASTSNVVPQAVIALPGGGLALGPTISNSANYPLAEADFNGDGHVDLVGCGFGLQVLLGDGTGNFHVSYTYPSADLIYTAAVGDFNGDGNTDIAIQGTSSVVILLGKGDGTFQPPAALPLPFGPEFIAVADFNGDGKADIVAVPFIGDVVYILLGNGDGTFQPPVSYQANGFPESVLVADFNGDGKADLAVNGLGSVSILLGNGDGTFQAPVAAPFLNYPILSLAVGDFNGDGKADLVTSQADVLLGNGDGTFQRPVSYARVLNLSPQAYGVVGDFNGDGKTDLAFTDSDTVSLLFGAGDGTFLPPVLAAVVPGFGFSPPLLGDFNGDGKTDLAVSDGNYTRLTLLLGTTVTVTPAGTPQSTAITTRFPIPLQVTVKDGSRPLGGVTVTFTVVPASSGAAATLSSGSAVTDLNGVASVTAVANLLPGGYTVIATAQGVSTLFSLTNAGVYLSAASGSPTTQSAPVDSVFPRPLQVVLTELSLPPAPVSGVSITFTAPGSGASAVLSASTVVTDASGMASVTATANHIPGSYQVTATIGTNSVIFSLTNLPAGSVSVVLTTLPNPSSFGAPVTMTATVSSPNANGRVTFFDGATLLGVKPASGGAAAFSTVLLSAGTHKLTAYYRDDRNAIVGTSNAVTQMVRAAAGGAFVSENPLGLTPAGSPVVVGDFNHDGKVDFAFPIATGVTVILGNGDGTFGTPVNYATPGGANFLVASDFDGDGNPDLAAGNSGGTVSVLLGNGDGTFRAGASFGVGNNMGVMAVGDFNSDGKADLIFTYSGTNIGLGGTSNPYTAVNLLPGNGDGTFGPQTAYGSLGNLAGGPAPLLVGDWNGDGKPDAFVANVPSVRVSPMGSAIVSVTSFILFGKGDGTIQNERALVLGDLASVGPFVVPNSTPVQSLIAGDFNGDGKLDLAAGGVAPSTNSPVTEILLGNGDGSFQPPVSYPGIATASGDFNGDGITDLVTAAGILLGNSDGTFTQGPAFSGVPLAVADFNGDGIADILAANSAGGLTVWLGASSTTRPPGSITASGGTPQSAPLGTAFPNALQVTVKDASGLPIGGATVNFSAPSGGASATLSSASAVTNASGVASVTAVANIIPGSYLVTASVAALSTSFSLTNVIIGIPDLAQGKAATQSSTLPGYATAGAASAVDGNTDGNFFDGSVTATNLETNPWWQVDLGAPVNLNSIVVWNRTDACCVSRLADYWVFVSNTPFLPTDTPTTLQNRAGTLSIHQATAPNPSTAIRFEAILAQGRYLRVQLSGTNYLSLAEVQVFGNVAPQPTNIAQGKLASQSSTFPGYASASASSAVDGNQDGNFGDGSVTATNADPNAWWQVDLGASAGVSSIVVWNRTDCCGSRLGDYWVFVSDTPFLPTDTPATLQNRAGTFSSHQGGAPNPSTTIAAAAQGRYVRVQLSGTDYLSLAEVQVFGIGGAAAPTNVAQGKAATQSSTLPGYATDGAAAAVDGSTDGNFFDGSVTATNLDPNAWWQVDLGASTAVSAILIFNRTDCCGSRLNDYWVFVSDTPFLATDTPATLQNRAGTFASHQNAAPNPGTILAIGAQGRYVRVQLSGTNYLSLAEVQVVGQ